MLNTRKLEKLRKSARLHVNWLIASVLGLDVLTKAERDELVAFNLPVKELDLAEKSFILGRLKALLKKSEWKDLDWESLEERKLSSLTPVEKLAVESARTRAAVHIKSLAEDITNGVFLELQKAQNAAVSEASIQQIVKDEVALGVIEKKHYKQVASSIAEKTKTTHKKRWESITRTELHSAKIQGTVQAIINKVDVYEHSDGPDSLVSVIPHPGTCLDCADHYLDDTGTPLVFKLSDLIAAGSNADPGVVHTKEKGIHTHWKTTLPPMHPNCRCELVYIPPGYSWVSGKLTMTDPNAFKKAIDDTSRTLQATRTPAGPPQPSKPATPASVPGIKSPAQKTPAASAVAQNSGQGPQMQPCPFGGGPECEKHGGNGAKTHESGGSIMRAHQEALAAGAQASDPQAAEALTQQTIKDAVEWSKQDHPHAVALDHLSNGKIIHSKKLGDVSDELPKSGMQEVFKVTIEGNGNACHKPEHTWDDKQKNRFEQALGWTEGITTVPWGTGADNEAAAYSVHMALGLTDHVPPCVTKVIDGKKSSLASWQETHEPLMSATLASKHSSKIAYMLDGATKEQEAAILERVSEGVAMSIVLNHQDQHGDNILFDPETKDLKFIDNSGIAGTGMQGIKSSLLWDMTSTNRPVKVPEKLMDRFSKTSLGDIKRSMSNLADWQQGQTFLRMKYVEHLQKEEGHIDPDKFRTVMPYSDDADSYAKARMRPGSPGLRKLQFGDEKASHDLLEAHELMGITPNQLFESFAKQWIDQHSSDPTSPHYQDAQELDSIGVFMPSNAKIMNNPAAFRASGKHKEYAESIIPRDPTKHKPATRMRVTQPTKPLKPIEEAPTVPEGMSGTALLGAKAKKSLFIRVDLLKGHN